MKKYLLGLAALVASAFCMMLPTTASASTVTLGGVTCNNNNATFPTTQFWYCTPSGTQQGPLLSRLGNTGADAISKFTTSGQQLYVFKNYADYYAFCGGGTAIACDASVGTENEWGRTILLASPIYSVAFEERVSGGVTLTNPYLDNTLMHELGHQLDLLYGAALGGGGGGYVSGGTTWMNLLNNKSLPKFNAFFTIQCGSGGLFRTRVDLAGDFICSGAGGTGSSLNAPYSGNNWAVLQAAQGYYFTDTRTPGAYSEWFAETFANQTGAHKSGAADPNYYIDKDGLDCHVFAVNKLRSAGRYPVGAEYPNYCR